jgi:hypothetical protein
MVREAAVAALRLKRAEHGGKGVAMRENTSFTAKNGYRVV